MIVSNMSTTFHEKPIIQGVLWKRAQKSRSNWKKRYFKLFANRLTYSIKENGKVRGEMKFTEEFFVQDGVAPQFKFGFLVTDFTTYHHLAADTKDVKEFWCHAIATVIRKQLELARYFEDSETKAVNMDEAEKLYQQRLDNYYKTVQRPLSRQHRESFADRRAAQVLAEVQQINAQMQTSKSPEERAVLEHESKRLSLQMEAIQKEVEQDLFNSMVKTMNNEH